MDRQAFAKLQMLMNSLQQRAEDEKDFFLGFQGNLRSGIKTFPFVCKLDEDTCLLSMLGKKERCTAATAIRTVMLESEKYDGLSLLFQVRGEDLHLEADGKKVSMKTTRLAEERQESVVKAEQSTLSTSREYRIKAGRADALLKEIGIMTAQGKIRNDMIRKYNQIDHFVELLEPMITQLAEKKGELLVVDCGCGKSYLSFVLNWFIREELRKPCRFVGLDIQPGVIASSVKTAENLGYRNMQFHAVDIRQIIPGDQTLFAGKPDLVISLHACDVATDYALAFGLRHEARAIVSVPCCHQEWLSQYKYEPFQGIMQHGVLKARMADILTDGYRSMMLESFGYEVSLIEYISPLDTPKNLLIRAQKKFARDEAKYAACKQFAASMGVVSTLENELLGFF